MMPRELKKGSMMSCEPSAKMMCSDWFLLSWKRVIFSLAMALKSIFTTPEKLAWKISVCPAVGLKSLMTWTGVAPELVEFACATTNGPFMTTFPRVADR